MRSQRESQPLWLMWTVATVFNIAAGLVVWGLLVQLARLFV